MLTRRVGVQHLELVEDAVQAALAEALQMWPSDGPPDDPGAWLYRVVLADLHRRTGNLELATEHRGRALNAAPSEAVRQLIRRRAKAEPRG